METEIRNHSPSASIRTKLSTARFLSIVGLIGFATSASSADYAPQARTNDYPLRADEFERLAYDPIPLRSMISAYVGVSGGWISYRSDASANLLGNWITRADLGAVNTYSNRSFFGDRMTYGLSAGIRSIVNGFDLRADIDTLKFSGHNTYASGFITSSTGPASFYGTTIESKIQNLIFLRFGFGMNGAYVTAGPAFASRVFAEYLGLTNPINGSGLPATVGCVVGQYCALVGGRNSSSRLGWVIGAGYEFSISGNIFGTIDYSYVNFPKIGQEYEYSNAGITYPTSFLNTYTASIVRFGLRYYLGN